MKIDTKARLLFAGFLLLVMAAGVIWYSMSAGRYATVQIYTRDPVSGLLVDAPVEFHGVEVGKVRSIRLIDPRLVSVLLAIEKSAPVTSATVATIVSRGMASRGFTGYVYVSLEDSGTDAKPLAASPGEAYPVMRTGATKVDTLDTAMNQMKENVQAMTDLLQAVLDKNTVASLRQSAENLQKVSKVLADNSEKLNSIVAVTDRASRRVEPLLQSSQDTVKTLQAVTRRLEPLVESSQDTVRVLRSASARLEPLLESTQDTVKTIQTQMLPQAARTLGELDTLSSSFADTAASVNRDPSVLIRGRAVPRPGPGERK